MIVDADDEKMLKCEKGGNAVKPVLRDEPRHLRAGMGKRAAGKADAGFLLGQVTACGGMSQETQRERMDGRAISTFVSALCDY